MRTHSETSGKPLNATTFKLQASQNKKRKKEGHRKYLKRLQLKTSLTWERKESSAGSAENPIQDNSKEKHAKTHINQSIKN